MPQAAQTATKPKATKKRRSAPKVQPSDIQNIPHVLLKPSKLNPRKTFDEAKAAELAESIKAQGVLQNLVARKKGKHYEIAAGERRWRAVDDLIKKGQLPNDYALPVRVQELSDLELVELATTENAARDDMHPLDEANAFSKMLELGSDPESIALKMGMAERTVKQRIALASLCDEAQDALKTGELTLALAHALTSVSEETQQYVVSQAKQGYHWSARDVADFVSDQSMSVRMAIFPTERYSGEISQNLFTDDFEPCFLDTEQAKRLQLEAMHEKADEYRKTHAWVDAVPSSELDHSGYFSAGEGDSGVLLIFDEASGEVKIYEEAYRANEPEAEASETPTKKRDDGAANSADIEAEAKPKLPKTSYTKKLLTEARVQKTHALQNELVGQFRTCLILNIMGLLGVREILIGAERPSSDHSKVESERARDVFAQHESALKATSKYARLGDSSTYPLCIDYGTDPGEVYSYLKAQTDEALQDLLSALTAVRIGSWVGHNVDLGDEPLALALAEDLAVDMHRYVTLDKDHLKLYRKAQLAEIARELGTTYSVDGFKVSALINYIDEKPGAKDYLPPVMSFFPKGEAPPTPTLAETLTQELANAA